MTPHNYIVVIVGLIAAAAGYVLRAQTGPSAVPHAGVVEQYMILNISTDANLPDSQRKLNDLAKEGWRITAFDDQVVILAK